MDDRAIVETAAGPRVAVLLASFARLTGAPLAADSAALWALPKAVLAHDGAAEPRFIYGNACALGLFRMAAADFIGMPSHLSAEPGERAQRAAMFAQLEAADIVRRYTGVRIAADGARFAIRDAVIWNLVDANGTRHGQAALLPLWTWL